MATVRCLICSNDALKAYVNPLLDKGVSNAGIAAGLGAAGGHLDPDVVGRHKKNHWTAPVDPAAPKPTKRDLAIMLRDKVADAIESGAARKQVVITKEGITIEEVPFDVLDKEIAAGLSVGLKAQALLDKREATDKKLGLAAGYLGLQMLLQGLGEEAPEPAMLDDGNTLEGEFEEMDG